MEALVLASSLASSAGGKIKIGEVEIPDVDALGLKLERDSQGLLLVDSKGAKYIALPIQDIADLLEISKQAAKLAALLGTTPVTQGSTLEAVNPAITQEKQALNQLIEEFTQT